MADNLKNLNIECSYCGGSVVLMFEENDGSKDAKAIATGYECVKMGCWAEWDLVGNATGASRQG